MSISIDIGSDNLVTVDDLTDASTGLAVTDATIEATLKTRSGTTVATATLTYDADDARYEGTLAAADLAGLTEGQEYVIHLDISGSGDAVRRVACRAVYRGAC